ncbi:YciI family protein [Aliiroseovarius subalbicans]|uniref:YciI family protein n=1 Tax=Aliiroseovarius subalbicans TaxID=2925840 RepID=UPI001F5981FE|nr:YciI family protein [Aliiroseovarius subalbicans]MCI2400014.1 YciI family protein [Aliiroseovarius subalbicans]
MLAALICTDKPGALDIRKANRDAHVAYLKSTGAVQAGPFLDENGDMCGSLVILDVADLSAARDWAAQDPYAKAGLFADVRIEQWNKVI